MQNTNQILPPGSGIPPEGVNPLVAADSDTASLPTAIQEWRRINDEMGGLKQQIREKARRAKALEAYIMNIMKRYNIGALDLKSSNGRVLYKRSKRSSALSAKDMGKHVAEFMKSEEKAAELLNFLNERKTVKQTEKLAYENFD
jgi:hypothetical protein